MKLFEAVPNFSEGRDTGTIEAIAAAARDVPGVAILDVEWNADHNRSVISLAGEASPLLDGLLGMIRVAVERIDLRTHRGEHPRMGAVDVVPFVPLGEATMDEAILLAERLGSRVWEELRVPVYLYGRAARRPERADLAVVRQGEFEGIRDSIGTDPVRRPDFGDAAVHPTAGVVAIGARPVLIAYNVYLDTPDVSVAKKIAHAVRGRDGGLPEVKALGFFAAERQQAQVSMNLTDYRRTSVHQAFDAVRRAAADQQTQVIESEIVGLVPEDALFDAAEFYLELKRFDRGALLERKVRAATGSGEPAPGAPFAKLSVAEFAARVAERTPTPGGGSVAAVSAAFAAALGEMVLAYSVPKGGANPELDTVAGQLRAARQEFLAAADGDARAYENVRAARTAWKKDPADGMAVSAWVTALRHAIEVPETVARRSVELAQELGRVRPHTKAALASDLASALALFRAARDAGLANAEINVADLRDTGTDVSALESEIARLRSTTLT